MNEKVKIKNRINRLDSETETCSSKGISFSNDTDYKIEMAIGEETSTDFNTDFIPDFDLLFKSVENIFGNKKFYKNEFDAFTKYYEVINEDNSVMDLVNAADCLPFTDYCDLYEGVKHLNSENSQHIELRSFRKSNENVSCASNCVKIKESTVKGRHLVAQVWLDPNEVLINEKATILQVNPLCVCNGEENKLYRCHDCAAACSKFLTCNSCNIVVFCSIKCLKKSHKEYHRYECEGLQRHYWSMDDTNYSYIALRMVLYGALHNFSLEIKDNGYYGNEDNNYPFINTLKSNFDKLPLKKVFQILEYSAKTLIYLICRTSFFNQFNVEDERLLHLYVGGLLVKHYCQAQTNNVLLKFPNMQVEFGFNVISGTGKAICPTIALLSHSCTPNATVIPYNNRIIVKTLKPIKENEEITICYQEIDAFLPIQDRRTISEELFYFTCRCNMCLYEESWEKYPYKCGTCSNGTAKKVTLNNQELGYCKSCNSYFKFYVQAEKLAQVCCGLYRATFEIDPVLRIAECYDKLYPRMSWMMLDVYRLLFDKYSVWGEKPIEIIKYGLLVFTILEQYVPRLYKPLLEAKLRFFFSIANNEMFLQMEQVSGTDYDTIKMFCDKVLKTKKDILFYLPIQYADFYFVGLLPKLEQVQFNLQIIEEREFNQKCL